MLANDIVDKSYHNCALLFVMSVPGTPDDTIQALDAGIENWLKSVEVICTYRLERGFATSLSNALSGRLQKRSRKSSPHEYACTGIFAKSQTLIRQTKNYNSPPIEDGEKVYNVPFDEVSNDEIDVSYNSSIGEPTGVARVNIRHPQFKKAIIAGVYAAGEINPLAIFGGEAVSPLRYYLDRPDSVRSKLEEIGDNKIEIEMEYSSGSVSETRTVIIGTSYAVPVVDSISNITKSDGVTVETHVRASEFVAFQGGMIPSRICSAVPTQDKNRWIAFIWTSDDMRNQRRPAPSDFIVQIPEHTNLMGLKQFPKNGVVDVTKIGLDDLVTSTSPISTLDLSIDEATNRGGWQRFFLVATMVVTAILGTLLLRAKLTNKN